MRHIYRRKGTTGSQNIKMFCDPLSVEIVRKKIRQSKAGGKEDGRKMFQMRFGESC